MSLNLKTLLEQNDEIAAAIKNGQICLMRHSYRSDSAVLKEGGIHLLPDSLELASNLSIEDKESAFRTIKEIAEIACAEQGRDALNLHSIVLSFVRTEGRGAEFSGAFRVLRKSNLTEFKKKYASLLRELPTFIAESWGFSHYVAALGYSTQPREENFYWDLEEIESTEISSLRNRLIVDWSNPRRWLQAGVNQPVLELRAKGFVRPFNSVHNATINLGELERIIQSPSGNPEWFHALSNTAGIYLILDKRTGQQYIGSAYGHGGIWGRWRAYAQTGHGNNQGLIGLVDKDQNRRYDFQFSILQILDKNTPRAEVIAKESLWKIKLGTRVYGLNAN